MTRAAGDCWIRLVKEEGTWDLIVTLWPDPVHDERWWTEAHCSKKKRRSIFIARFWRPVMATLVVSSRGDPVWVTGRQNPETNSLTLTLHSLVALFGDVVAMRAREYHTLVSVRKEILMVQTDDSSWALKTSHSLTHFTLSLSASLFVFVCVWCGVVRVCVCESVCVSHVWYT